MSHTDFATRAKMIALVVVVCACLSHSIFGQTPKTAVKGPAASLAGKEKVTILITDSGLGGLSVVSQIENRLQQCHCVSQVRLIFANALPDNEHPYNRMASGSEKAKALSDALDGFTQRFHPDLILVACNTLSVVYPETDFAKRTPVPVFGIVEIGSELMAEYLAIHPDGDVIILGTPTTAESNAHRNTLEQNGIASHRITVQGCDQLETEIQANPSSDLVHSIIDMYAQEAISLRDSSNDGETAIALCCTHYPYVKDAFEQAFTSLLGKPVTIIDPNAAMAAALFEGADCARNAATISSIEVVSRARIAPADVAAIANLLKAESSATAAALQSYVYDTTLFEYRP